MILTYYNSLNKNYLLRETKAKNYTFSLIPAKLSNSLLCKSSISKRDGDKSSAIEDLPTEEYDDEDSVIPWNKRPWGETGRVWGDFGRPWGLIKRPWGQYPFGWGS